MNFSVCVYKEGVSVLCDQVRSCREQRLRREHSAFSGAVCCFLGSAGSLPISSSHSSGAMEEPIDDREEFEELSIYRTFRQQRWAKL